MWYNLEPYCDNLNIVAPCRTADEGDISHCTEDCLRIGVATNGQSLTGWDLAQMSADRLGVGHRSRVRLRPGLVGAQAQAGPPVSRPDCEHDCRWPPSLPFMQNL